MSQEKKFIIRCRAVILRADKLLLVRHPHADFFALPGGHLEWGEGIQSCMEREVEEELGVKPRLGRLLYVYTFVDKNELQSVEFFFEILNGEQYLGCESLARTHEHEVAEIVWADGTGDIRMLPERIHTDFKSGDLLSDEPRFFEALTNSAVDHGQNK